MGFSTFFFFFFSLTLCRWNFRRLQHMVVRIRKCEIALEMVIIGGYWRGSSGFTLRWNRFLYPKFLKRAEILPALFEYWSRWMKIRSVRLFVFFGRRNAKTDRISFLNFTFRLLVFFSLEFFGFSFSSAKKGELSFTRHYLSEYALIGTFFQYILNIFVKIKT